MTFDDIVTTARDALTARRVFAEPVERDGVTLIPAAVIRGGLGGGGGQRSGDGGPAGTAETGEGGGFGLVAGPVGAYSIRDGRVRWHPAVNVNLFVTAAASITITWLITRRRKR
jgi:uncharacterized spore protein YtfJ